MNTDQTSFQSYASKRSHALFMQGRDTTSNHYDIAIKKFTKIIGIVPLKDLSSELIMRFDEAIRAEGLCDNTAMYYMRTLKSIYNNAVKKGFVKDNEPFKYVRCGVARTKKRAITEEQLKSIYNMRINNPRVAFARDMFILSFVLRGMAPIDMQKLTKRNIIADKVLIYKRSKTGKELTVELTDQAKEIIKRHELQGCNQLLPLSKNRFTNINKKLKLIGQKAGVLFPLSMYCARHTWATLSRSHNVPLSVISSGMGHSSEQITQVYLSEIETSVVDKYNNELVSSIFK